MNTKSIGSYIVIIISMVFSFSPLAQASQVTPMGLETVVEKSAQIFVGEVLSVEAGHDDAGLPYVAYQVDVSHAIFGIDTGVTELRFLGELDGLSPLAGLPTYEAGDELLLFLRAASSRGLSSPVGMELGSLPIAMGATAPLVKPHPLLIQETLSLTPHERQVLSRGTVEVESLIDVVETILDRKNLR